MVINTPLSTASCYNTQIRMTVCVRYFALACVRIPSLVYYYLYEYAVGIYTRSTEHGYSDEWVRNDIELLWSVFMR